MADADTAHHSLVGRLEHQTHYHNIEEEHMMKYPGTSRHKEPEVKRVGEEFCDNTEIFYILDDGKYYRINGSECYPKNEWLLQDAVTHYKSEAAKMDRFISDWDAWCG